MHPQPGSVAELWRCIDEACADDAGFHAGAILAGRASGLAAYFNRPAGKGARFAYRLRESERTSRQQDGTRPLSPFNCVGPTVGPGSLAGMRFLRALRAMAGGGLRVWPFEAPSGACLVAVEIFPQAYIKSVLGRTSKVTTKRAGGAAVEAFGGRRPKPAPGDGDAAAWDALISAPALRGLAAEPGVWRPVSMGSCARAFEGWIFGVR